MNTLYIYFRNTLCVPLVGLRCTFGCRPHISKHARHVSAKSEGIYSTASKLSVTLTPTGNTHAHEWRSSAHACITLFPVGSHSALTFPLAGKESPLIIYI